MLCLVIVASDKSAFSGIIAVVKAFGTAVVANFY